MAKITTNKNHAIVKTALCFLPPLLLAVVFYLHFQTQLSIFSPVCRCASHPASAGAVNDHVDRLRASATFLPLKDTRQGAETWFISTLNATAEPEGEARNLVFPSPASAGRLLCLSAPSRRDGAKNAYALAWRDALPRGAALLPGLAFVSETAYDHTNIWHGLTSLVPFASWHERSGCKARPARWALFHHGEVRTEMSGWLATLAEATTGAAVAIETFDAPSPVCFEEAVVFRANVAGMNQERMLRAADFMRCKARAYCGVDASKVGGGSDPAALRVTLLFRTGARAFKDEAGVTRVFQKECERVAGCAVAAAHANNLTFCEQVGLAPVPCTTPNGLQEDTESNPSLVPVALAGEVAERDGRADLVARGADDQLAVHGQEQQHHGVLPSGLEAESRGRPVRVPVDGELGRDAARGFVVGTRRRAVPQQSRHPRLLEGTADRALRDLLRAVGRQSLRRGQGAQDGECHRGFAGWSTARCGSMQVQLVAFPLLGVRTTRLADLIPGLYEMKAPKAKGITTVNVSRR
jgi:hypothetical protein